MFTDGWFDNSSDHHDFVTSNQFWFIFFSNFKLYFSTTHKVKMFVKLQPIFYNILNTISHQMDHCTQFISVRIRNSQSILQLTTNFNILVWIYFFFHRSGNCYNGSHITISLLIERPHKIWMLMSVMQSFMFWNRENFSQKKINNWTDCI